MNSDPAEAQPPHQPEDAANITRSDPSSEHVVREHAAASGESDVKPSPVRGRIQIGSRREPSRSPAKPPPPATDTAEQPTFVEPPRRPAAPVPTPSVRDPLPPDLERQLAEAMGDASLDEILGAAEAESPMPALLEPESRVRAPVIRIHGDHVFFSLGGRHEGVTSLRQFPEPPSLGTDMDVVIKSYNTDDGLYELIIPGVSSHVEDWSDLTEGALVEARITGANTGGLECKVGTIRGFIPSSQIAMFRVEDYAEYLEQKMLCIVTEVNPKRQNLVLSRRAVLEREKEEARQQRLESLEVGQVVEGEVRKVLDFGAFVDLGGLDGLVHVSQLSWDRVNHPSEVLQEGQKIRVKIEKVDHQTGKIGLSYRDLLEHPWTRIEEQFPVDSLARGTVSRIAKFGAFVKLAPGVEGLVHISELAHGRVPSVGSVVKEGQEVEVTVLSVDAASQRMSLSIKAALPVPAAEAVAESEADESGASRRESAVPSRREPLRGGTSRDSGGDQFGLKW
jgi:ribosomal protein S1